MYMVKADEKNQFAVGFYNPWRKFIVVDVFTSAQEATERLAYLNERRTGQMRICIND